MQTMPQLIVLCGLQGSGKSTKAKELQEDYQLKNPNNKVVILSSDQIRADHPEIADDNAKVFAKLYADMNYYLSFGDTVIIDSTAITMKSRRQVFANLRHNCFKICYIMNTPYNICKERVLLRNNLGEHKVPLDVLERYYRSFEIPFYEEGWDDIILDNIITQEDSDENKKALLTASKGFNQRNKHHTQDLGEHMQYVGEHLAQNTLDNLLVEAGYYHDVGKLFTQSVDADGQCHYYNHANVGTYNLMCCSANYNLFGKYRKDHTLKWLCYINYHMILHNATTEKSIKKYKRIFGDILYNDLKLFESIDKSRPG